MYLHLQLSLSAYQKCSLLKFKLKNLIYYIIRYINDCYENAKNQIVVKKCCSDAVMLVYFYLIIYATISDEISI